MHLKYSWLRTCDRVGTMEVRETGLRGLIALARKWAIRSVLTRVATLLVTLGVTLLTAGPPIWQWVIVVIVTRFTGQPPDSPSPWLAFGIPILCVLAGALLFFLQWRSDIRDTASRRALSISLPPQRGWIKRIGASKIAGSLRLRLDAGSEAGHIYRIEVDRFVEGCRCQWAAERVSAPGYEDQLRGDCATLVIPLKFDEHASFEIVHTATGFGPTQHFDQASLENGEYEVVIRYRLRGDQTDSTFTLFAKQQDGEISSIEMLTPPPLLNDRVVQLAHAKKLLTSDELSRLLALSERDRFLALRDRESHFSAFPDLRFELDFLMKCQAKIKAAGLCQGHGAQQHR